MFRAFQQPLLARVPYATLFAYNPVLQSVFEAPADKVALTVELPGQPVRDYTYGRLQRDVVALSNAVVQRRELVAKARGATAPLSWVQPHKPATVRSVFAQGDGTPSCDVLQDSGVYNGALMCGPGYPFVVSLLAYWAANHMAIPMSVSQKYNDELMYVLEHSGARMIIGETALLKEKFPAPYDPLTTTRAADLTTVNAASVKPGDETYAVESVMDSEQLVSERERTHKDEDTSSPLCFDTERLGELNALHRLWYENPSTSPVASDDCLMIYTSGTTARPKGAVHTHASVANMVGVLQQAWAWSDKDCIIHMLPVHHIHGLINILFCSLASKARCVSTKFDDPVRIAKRIAAGDITLVMAVPTIYTKIIASLNKQPEDFKQAFKASAEKNVRLMVCGSAALPVPTLNQFRELSGHTLLERYGMTEIGMALGQPLSPIEARKPGTVGYPLPTVETYVHELENSDDVEQVPESKSSMFETSGALAIASASLFDRYWSNAKATKKELVTDASGKRYFETGDTVGVNRDQYGHEVFTILGRSSVDIIKSRGYKLSALEIEAALLSRKELFYEVAVVGTPDKVRGESVVAICTLQPDAAAKLGVQFDANASPVESAELTEQFKEVAAAVLARYQCPSRFIFVPEIPRNPTGKVNKKHLKKALHID